jgi:hypothetical protein
MRDLFKRKPLLKYGLVTAGGGLWAYGLFEQFYSASATMTYILVSLLMLAVSVI